MAMTRPSPASLLFRIRLLTSLFILGLVISGLTAIPLQLETKVLLHHLEGGPWDASGDPASVSQWLWRIEDALSDTAERHPFLFYGTDWLAFGHLVIAIVFLGALRDPVRNRWLYDVGLIACALVIPWALVFGALRGIPIGWRLIDCAFGVFGALPLAVCRHWLQSLAAELKPEPAPGRRRAESPIE
jgi:hypothetical protein